jgi:hypothetical membrane protein
LVSVAFFVLAPIALFIFTTAFWLDKQKKLAAFTIIVAVVSAMPWLLLFAFNYVPNVAIPEAVSGLAISIWTVKLCSEMLRS